MAFTEIPEAANATTIIVVAFLSLGNMESYNNVEANKLGHLQCPRVAIGFLGFFSASRP